MKQKTAKTEFNQSNLPKTRKEQVFDIFKNKFRFLTSIGICLFIVTLPLIFSIIFKANFVIGIASDESYIINGVLSKEGYALIFQNTLFFGIINSICFVLIFIALGGILRVIRELYWGNHVSFYYDFFKGIKTNYKNSIIYGIIFGLSRLAIDLVKISGLEIIAKAIIYGVNFALFYPIIIIGMVYTSLYNGSFVKTCYHSFIVYIKKFLHILPILLIFISYHFISFFPENEFFLKIIVLICVQFFLTPLYILVLYAVELYCFDTVINSIYFPELKNKGLYNNE